MHEETAREGFRRLAFGSIGDAARLLFTEKIDPRMLKKMDLFSVSEIKRNKDGAIEVKFFDRMEALRMLHELEKDSSASTGFLAAIESGAAALQAKQEEEPPCS